MKGYEMQKIYSSKRQEREEQSKINVATFIIIVVGKAAAELVEIT
jgi:hypothetical protein